MTKTINPDVAAFKDDFFKGLSFRECIFGGSALLVGVGGILLLHFYFNLYAGHWNDRIVWFLPQKWYDIGSACKKLHKAHASKALCI